MKSPCLLLKVVIPTTIRCKVDNKKMKQWAIADVEMTKLCQENLYLCFYILVSLDANNWYKKGWMIPFWSETAAILSWITFNEKKWHLFHGVYEVCTCWFGSWEYIRCWQQLYHAFIGTLPKKYSNYSVKKDPYNLFPYVMPILWNLTIDKVYSLYIRCYYNY